MVNISAFYFTLYLLTLRISIYGKTEFFVSPFIRDINQLKNLVATRARNLEILVAQTKIH